MIRKLLWLLLIVFIVFQAFRPAKNNSGDKSKDISLSYPLPDSVAKIFDKACNDCHSNNTRYPLYAEIQPLGWWLNDHIKDGKKHFNLNEFSGYRIGRQYKKLEECIEQVKEGEMPLESYTVIHSEARLTDAEKQTLYSWCEAVRDSIKSKYPADSLVIKRKK
ncbi:MAG: heme-binding domain-containing protein [Chitinophagia bacterium]|jgi:hypothetical protein|nr:cytochrome C [Chitinophagia bacterium]